MVEFKAFNPFAMAKEELEKVEAQLHKSEVRQTRGPLTELGKEYGIEVYNAKPYKEQKETVYFYLDAQAPIYEVAGDPTSPRVKWVEIVPIYSLYAPGQKHTFQDRKAWRGSYVSTLGRKNLEAYGITGKDEAFTQLLRLNSDYFNARKDYEVYRAYGVTDMADVEGLTSELRKEKETNINQAVSSYTFVDFKPKDMYYIPVTMLSVAKGKDGKNIPSLPAGEIKGTHMWLPLGKTLWESLVKTLDSSLTSKATEAREGNIISISYAEAGEKDSSGNSKPASIGVVTTKPLYARLRKEGLIKQEPPRDPDTFEILPHNEEELWGTWDKETQELYTAPALRATVRNAEFKADAVVKEELEDIFGKDFELAKREIERVEKALETAKQLREGGVAQGADSGIVTASAGVAAIETASTEVEDVTPTATVDPDEVVDPDEIDFNALG